MVGKLALFCFGALGYGAIEVSFRGHTHWTMLVAGGVCLLLLEQVNLHLAAWPLLVRCGIGALTITGVELAFGLVCNRALHWGVWDYSNQWGNLLGQVCPLYTFLWFLLCIPILGCFSLAGRWLAGTGGL